MSKSEIEAALYGKRKVRTAKPLESDIQKAIIEYAWLTFRLRLYRRNIGTAKGSNKGKSWFVRFGEPGQADLWGIQPRTGRHVECEVKRPGGDLTEQQHQWIENCHQTGAISFWASSIEMFDEIYRSYCLGIPNKDFG